MDTIHEVKKWNVYLALPKNALTLCMKILFIFFSI